MKSCWKSRRIDTLCLSSVINNGGILFPLNTSANQYDGSVCRLCQVLIVTALLFVVLVVLLVLNQLCSVQKSNFLLHCIIMQIT